MQYSVKFICGKSPGDIMAPGSYFTAINVHNPNNDDIGLRKKFAVALPRQEAGPVSEFVEARLGPDQAMEIDCPEIQELIRQLTGFAADFSKGFVVIETKVELDVVAVYTAAGSTGAIEALFLERVPPRQTP